jgi:nitrogen fixation protein NifZ
MAARHYEVGDLVYSRTDIYNDGGVPDAEDGALLAKAGTRGIVVRSARHRTHGKPCIYIIRFEGPDQLLGPPIGCLEEELTHDPSDGESRASGGNAR